MKVIHIIPSLRKGGAERLALDICIALKKLNHEVLLITFSPEDDYTFLSDKINKKVISSRITTSIFKKNSLDIDRLQAAISEFHPDVIHSHLFETEIVLSGISFPKAKFITHLHDNIPQFKKLSIKTLTRKKYITNYYERSIVLKKMTERKSSVIAISKDCLRYANTNFPKHIHKWLLHNAIDRNRFHPAITPQKELILSMIGSLVQKKGQALAIETLAVLKKRGWDANLNIIGDGVLKGELIDFAKEKEVIKDITFHGNIDSPENVLQKSRIYIHTAKYEPFGLALVEAMSTGLPVVCTDGLGNRDLIVDGENGYIIFDRKAENLAEKIEFLMKDKAAYNNMSRAALEFSSKFDINTYTEKLISIYNS